MANRFRGFARMLSTAKNSTSKGGLGGRMFSSEAKKSTKIPKYDVPNDYFMSDRMKVIFAGKDYHSLTPAQRIKIINRHVDIEMIKSISCGAAVALTLCHLYGYFAYGFYPFQEDPLGENKDYRSRLMELKALRARNGLLDE
ncbi:hypothetical protein MKW94_022402 [Papaver nudicaule]|uniref:Uncharacterized protein n=1 Tax=Papaver nudicaule TaxID=74823 RepID=A0AA41VZ17_PAPNU|nr:hypothetical protein [Papaver nudicaule]